MDAVGGHVLGNSLGCRNMAEMVCWWAWKAGGDGDDGGGIYSVTVLVKVAMV